MVFEKKYRAALISLGSKSSKMTLEAMKKYFKEVDDINIKRLEVNLAGKDAQILYEGKPLKEYDCIYAKGSFRYAPLLSSITNLLSKKTYMPIAESAFTVVHDKLLTHLALQREGIPMPRTYIAATTEAAKGIMKKMNFPIIMKFPQGTQGKGVVFADSFNSASSILDALTALRQPFILQEYVETNGTDIRAFVVGNQIVASMKRISAQNESRANLHAGGRAKKITLSKEAERIAIKAAKAVKAEICGVDILESIKGPLVIEANISPGLQGITNITEIDVADYIAKHLFEKTKIFKGEEEQKTTNKIMEEINGSNILMTTLDFRGERVLLPSVITKKAKLNDEDLYEIIIKKNQISITKMDIK